MQNLRFLILIPFIVSCTIQPEEPIYRIHGEIEGLSDAKVYLEFLGHRDTINVGNGEFFTSGSVTEPVLGKIVIVGIGSSREFYIENSDIELKGHIDSLEYLKVEGSKTEAEIAAYKALLKTFEEKYSEIESEYETADPERQAKLEENYAQEELKQVEAQKQFVKQHPSSFLCLEILSEIDWSFNSASELDEYVGLLDSSLLRYEGAIYLLNLVERMKKVEIGEKAPDFVMDDMDGIPIRLSELYPNSVLLLIDFWASTCGPCRIENENIRRAYEKYQDKGLEILGVSTDIRKEPWIQAIEKDGLIWKNVCSLKPWGDNDVVEKYALRQVSQNFLLDKNGFIVAKDLRGEELFSKIGNLLNQSVFIQLE